MFPRPLQHLIGPLLFLNSIIIYTAWSFAWLWITSIQSSCSFCSSSPQLNFSVHCVMLLTFGDFSRISTSAIEVRSRSAPAIRNLVYLNSKGLVVCRSLTVPGNCTMLWNGFQFWVLTGKLLFYKIWLHLSVDFVSNPRLRSLIYPFLFLLFALPLRNLCANLILSWACPPRIEAYSLLLLLNRLLSEKRFLDTCKKTEMNDNWTQYEHNRRHYDCIKYWKYAQ